MANSVDDDENSFYKDFVLKENDQRNRSFNITLLDENNLRDSYYKNNNDQNKLFQRPLIGKTIVEHSNRTGHINLFPYARSLLDSQPYLTSNSLDYPQVALQYIFSYLLMNLDGKITCCVDDSSTSNECEDLVKESINETGLDSYLKEIKRELNLDLNEKVMLKNLIINNV
ncbi:hypothetical protein [Sulfolobus sp. E11-6]|uniref:hypothetical protein n=1 Tax=Sulfolobus sp. E11-6 TaxID=2663020 RepID=UPI001296C81B|nr:hypothetical protein [Sulfolobus sp. E11-6]QGA68938.1 hypothetical protein GFS33_09625 [Sulfolobus sp. E11-6]